MGPGNWAASKVQVKSATFNLKFEIVLALQS